MNKSILQLGLYLSFILMTSNVNAQLVHEPSAEELQKLQSDPAYFSPRNYTEAVPDWSPKPDTVDYKFVLMSSETGFPEVANLRYTIAKNLPEGVKLVLLVDQFSADRVRQQFSKYISPDRLILATASNISTGFWARDAFPYPVVDSKGKLSLVQARYYRGFGGGDAIANSVSLPMTKNSFTFVGGNLQGDENGVCFSINGPRMYSTTENDLRNAYGCKDVRMLKHLTGIGDVDEVVKVMGNGLILTNQTQYVNDFQQWGYRVVMLPNIPNSYRTYANSLIVGKTAFMPTYGMSSDQEAQRVYESLGYKVIGIPTIQLSDDMHGSIHCQTMAYPNVTEAQLLEMLKLKKVN